MENIFDTKLLMICLLLSWNYPYYFCWKLLISLEYVISLIIDDITIIGFEYWNCFGNEFGTLFLRNIGGWENYCGFGFENLVVAFW